MGLPRLTKTTGTPGAPGAFRGMQNAPSAKFLCSRQPCQGAVAESDACAQKHPQDESIAGILSKTAGYANGAHQCSRSFHIVLLFDHSVKGKSCRALALAKEKPCRIARQGKGMRGDYCFTLSTTARVISMSTYWPSGMSSRVAFSSFSRSSRPSTR